MRNPRPFRLLVVTTDDGRVFHGLTWSPERGFFEPITNTTAEAAGVRVVAWEYEET